MTKFTKPSDTLFRDLRSLIIEARQDVARQVNSVLVLLYWRVAKRIQLDILKEKRAEYGEQIIATLSQQLVAEFGAGFTARNLANMVRFADVFQDEKILHTLCAKLSWSHFRLIIYQRRSRSYDPGSQESEDTMSRGRLKEEEEWDL